MPQSTGRLFLDESNLPMLKPLGVYLLVEPEESPAEKSGIIIPDKAKEFYPICAKVLDLGDEVPDGKFDKGDRIIYSKYSGLEIRMSSELRYFLIPYQDVVAILLNEQETLSRS